MKKKKEKKRETKGNTISQNLDREYYAITFIYI
jgi:hypothetical protein